MEEAARNDLIDHHNSIVRRASVRALELENAMTALLIPIFDEVADEAARQFSALAPLQTITATGAPINSLSTMVCVMPTAEQQQALAQEGGEDAADIHCTLCFLGEFDGPLEVLSQVLQQVAATHAPLEGEIGGRATFSDNGNGAPSILLPDVPGLVEMRVDVTKALHQAGVTYMRNHGFTPHLTLGYGMDSPPADLLGQPINFDHLMLVRGNEERVRLPLTGAKPLTASAQSIVDEIIKTAEDHQVEGGYGETAWNSETATVLWVCGDWSSNEEIEAAEEAFLAIDGVDHFDYEAEGMPDGWCDADQVYPPGGNAFHDYCDEREASSIMAAAAAPPLWTQPASSDLIDVDALVAKLRAAMDPVREKAVLTVIKTAVETAPIPSPAPTPEKAENVVSVVAAARKPKGGVGIAFDVTNPIVQAQIASSGAQIQNIAEGTRKKIASIIGKSYTDGLSVDHTATELRTTMKRFSPSRARLIARTELAGAVNGGSLAATQILDDAAGGLGISKVWLTAPGAPNPRHETYSGLDGQIQVLDQPFDVGGNALQYPGDPAGDPGEVCNCRCSISYQKAGQVIAQDSADDAIDPMQIAADAEEGGGGDAVDEATAAPEEAEPVLAQDSLSLPADSAVTAQDYADPITDGPAAKLFSKEQRAWGKSLTEDETEAFQVYQYKSSNGEAINRFLRGKRGVPWGSDVQESSTARWYAKQMDSAIAKAAPISSASDVQVFRGVEDLRAVFGKDIAVGQRITDKGFISTTTDLKTAVKFESGAEAAGTQGGVIEITVPAGTRAAWLSSVPGTDFPMLKELLLARNSTLEVQSISTMKDGRELIKARLVPSKAKVVRAADVLSTPGDLPEVRTTAEDVRVVRAVSDENPHAHLQDSSLNAYISLYRKQMRDLLNKPELTQAEAEDFKKLQFYLEDAIKERSSRSGIPERPFAHLSDAQLERQMQKSEQAISEIKPRTKAAKVKQEELKSKLAAIKKETSTRARAAKKEPKVAPTRERKVKVPPLPKTTAARRGVIPSAGREPEITVEKRAGSGYELRGSYIDKRTGEKMTWTSRRFATKAEAEDARARHVLGYSPVEQREFVLANLPGDIEDLGLKGRDYGFFDPARDPQLDVLGVLQRLKAEGITEQDRGIWRITPARPPMEGGIRKPYTPPEPPRNARMQRLQDAYAARYAEYRDTSRFGTVIAPGAPQPTLAEVKAVGNDFRNEVEARLRYIEKQRFTGTPAERKAARARWEAQTRREAILEVLSEIRPLAGPDSLKGISAFSNADATSILRNAASFYPKDWDSLLGDLRLDVSRTGDRSGVTYFSDQRRFVVELNGARAGTAQYQYYLGERVSIHELGHVYEQVVDGLPALEREFYAERTQGEKLLVSATDGSTFFREDDFVNAYMGRDYYNVAPGSLRMPTGDVFELMSMGMESMMTGSNPIWRDPDMVNFLLGMLASL